MVGLGLLGTAMIATGLVLWSVKRRADAERKKVAIGVGHKLVEAMNIGAIAGLPIVTIPMGLVAGLPVGVCLVGPSASEERLIAVARRLEGRLGLVDDPSWRPTFSHPSRG